MRPMQLMASPTLNSECDSESDYFGGGSERLFSGSGDRTIKLWDPQTGKELQTLRGHTGGVLCLAASPMSAAVCMEPSSDGMVNAH